MLFVLRTYFHLFSNAVHHIHQVIELLGQSCYLLGCKAQHGPDKQLPNRAVYNIQLVSADMYKGGCLAPTI